MVMSGLRAKVLKPQEWRKTTYPEWGEALQRLSMEKPLLYEVLTLDASVARDNQEYAIAGDFISIEHYPSTVPFFIRLNEPDFPELDLSRLDNITTLFYRLFITNNAGNGNIVLKIGRRLKLETRPFGEDILSVELVSEYRMKYLFLPSGGLFEETSSRFVHAKAIDHQRKWGGEVPELTAKLIWQREHDKTVYICDVGEKIVLSNTKKLFAPADVGVEDFEGQLSLLNYEIAGNGKQLAIMSYVAPNYKPILVRFNKDYSELKNYVFPTLDGANWASANNREIAIAHLIYVTAQGDDVFAFYTVADDSKMHLYLAYCADIGVATPNFVSKGRIFTGGSADGADCLTFGRIEAGAQFISRGNGFFGLVSVCGQRHTRRQIFPAFMEYEGYSGGTSGNFTLGFADTPIVPFQPTLSVTMPPHNCYPFINYFPDDRLYMLCGYNSLWCTPFMQEWMQPEAYNAIHYRPWSASAISAGANTAPMIGKGKKTIWFTTNTGGDLTIQLCFNGKDWVDLETMAVAINTTKWYQTIYSAYWIRLKFSAAAIVSANVIVEVNK